MEVQEIIELMKCFDDSKAVSLAVKIDNVQIEIKKNETCSSPDIKQAASIGLPAEQELRTNKLINNTNKSVKNVEKSEKTEINHCEYIKAPLIGTFYRAPSPEDEPYVTIGSNVNKGDTIGLIESMKMINEINAPFDCIIEDILVENGKLTSFEEPIFRIKGK